jgi:hypothetical protein
MSTIVCRPNKAFQVDFEPILKGVGTFVGSVALVAAMYPAVRKRIARDNTSTQEARGESNWIIRREQEIAEQAAMIKELVASHRIKDETIAALRMREAVFNERHERLLRKVQQLEAFVIETRPDFAKWIQSDYSPLGRPEVPR